MTEAMEISVEDKDAFFETLARIEVESNNSNKYVRSELVRQEMGLDAVRFEEIVSALITSGEILRKKGRIYAFFWKSAIKIEERERLLSSLKKIERDESIHHVTLEVLRDELGMDKLNFYRICRILQQQDIIQVDQVTQSGSDAYLIKSKLTDLEDESSKFFLYLVLLISFTMILAPALVLLVDPIRYFILNFPFIIVFLVGGFVTQAFTEQILLLQMESALRGGYIKDRGQEQAGDRNSFEDGLISTRSIPLALNQVIVKSKPLVYINGIHPSADSTRSVVYRLYWWALGKFVMPRLNAGIILTFLMLVNILAYALLSPKLSDVLDMQALKVVFKYFALLSSLFVLFYYKSKRKKNAISVDMLVYTPSPSKRVLETFEVWSDDGKIATPLTKEDVINKGFRSDKNVYVRIRGRLNPHEKLHRKDLQYDYYQN